MRTVILGSGKGTNFKALLDAHFSGLLDQTEIVAVFSDRKSSGILEIAQKSGIPQFYLGSYNSSDKINDVKWISKIQKYRPELIVLAGFMKILSKQFIETFDSKIINLHPSLLPSFRGLNAIKQAWDAGVKITGCTIHWVSDELDSGRIIAQAPVRIMPSDSIQSVTAKVQAAEHMLLPTVVANLSKAVSA